MKSSIICVLLIAFVVSICNAKVAKDSKCEQPVQTGRCLAYIPKYAYDAGKGECVKFVYGGCGGNDNRFDSKNDCEKTCKA